MSDGMVGRGRKTGSKLIIDSRKSTLKFLSVVSMYSLCCRRSASLARLIQRYCWMATKTMSAASRTVPTINQFTFISVDFTARIIAFKHGLLNARPWKLYLLFTKHPSLYRSFTPQVDLSG